MYIGAFNLIQFIDDLSMNFVSGYFLLFVFWLFLFYYTAEIQHRWKVLLAGSFLFVLLGGGWMVTLVPVLATGVAYIAAIAIENTEKKEKRKRKYWVSSAVLTLLAALAISKVNILEPWRTIDFIFPIGISYYTFSLVAYVADVYWKRDKAEVSYWRLLLFTLWFPKILQGPIARHKNLGKQLVCGHVFSYDNLGAGLQLMLWGYFKKIVVADRLIVLVQSSFGNYHEHGGALVLCMIVLAAFQLYFDFSGCVDIARGISRVFGIDLEQNFNHPFFAQNAAEFWRRWHMTLSSWFLDYVYMPILISPTLMKVCRFFSNKYGKRISMAVRTIIPVSIVWVFTSMWHGTTANFMIWGCYWGGLIIIGTIFNEEFGQLARLLRINREASSWKALQMVRVFMIFAVGHFISTNRMVEDSWEMARKIFIDIRPWELLDGTLFNLGLDRINFEIAIGGIVFIMAVEVVQTKLDIRRAVREWNVVVRSFVYAMAVLLVLIFGVWGPEYNAAAFAYMNF